MDLHHALGHDPTGTYSGVAGSLLVGGVGVRLAAIRPDQSIVTIVSAGTNDWDDVDAMAVDAYGRLLVLGGRDLVNVLSGGALVPLVTTFSSTPVYMTTGADGRIYTGSLAGTIDVFASDGSVIALGFASGLGEVARVAVDEAGLFGGLLVAMGGDGILYSIADDGAATVIGSGFSTAPNTVTIATYLAFGPDGALYVSDHQNDKIWRIGQPAQVVPIPSTLLLTSTALLVLRIPRTGRRLRKSTNTCGQQRWQPPPLL